jgi:putative spermidine/putrescine transport system substrate-binding protein
MGTQGRLPGRRRALKTIGAVAALGFPYVRTARAAGTLFINTWGGIWEKAAAQHLFAPFSKESGAEIRTVSPVSFAKLAAQAKTGVYEFDVTTLGGADIVRANEAGLIEKVDESVISLAELWPGAVFQNGLGSHAFATAVAWRHDKFPKGGPRSWAEFWDLKRFPGSRCLQRHPARVLALALMADGVPADKLYPIDVNRAFAAMDRIKPAMRVWWTQGPQSSQLLRDGEVDAIGIWHGRVLELQQQNVPVELVWNQAQIDRAYWVVAKGTPRAKLAWQFVKSAVRAERVAGFCTQALYGPINPKAFESIPESAARHMPTYPANYKLCVEQDVTKETQQQLAEMAKRFDQWVAR